VVRRATLALRCESVKRALSTASEARLAMREAYLESGAPRDLELVIERTWVEPLWDPLFTRATDEVSRVLAEAGWAASDVDAVALVGGTSLVPRFQDHVQTLFPRVAVSARADAHVANRHRRDAAHRAPPARRRRGPGPRRSPRRAVTADRRPPRSRTDDRGKVVRARR
jgi:molecular chaperone DnaK (HSP70)